MKAQNLQEKAILLLDNAPSHPSAEQLKTKDGMIFVMFMPPNVTPLIQPMDQNILRLTKLYYRNSLLTSIVTGDDAVGAALKKITLKDAVLHLAAAWEKLSAQVIIKCWHNILVKTNLMAVEEDDLPLSVLQKHLKEKSDTTAVVKETIMLLQAIEPVSFDVNAHT